MATNYKRPPDQPKSHPARDEELEEAPPIAATNEDTTGESAIDTSCHRMDLGRSTLWYPRGKMKSNR